MITKHNGMKRQENMKKMIFILLLAAMLPTSIMAQCNPNATTKNLCLGIEPNIGASFSKQASLHRTGC